MAETIGQLAVIISATDKTAAGIASAKRQVESFQGATGKLTEAFKGLRDTAVTREIGTAFSNVQGHATDITRRLIRSATPIAGLGVAGGGAALVTNFVSTSRQLLSGARNLQMSVPELHAFQLGARQAGVSAEDATQGLRDFGETIYDAVGGRNMEALAASAGPRLGFSLRNAAGGARTASEALGDLAERVQMLNHDPRAQLDFARIWHVETLLPVLREGRAGVAELMRFGRANSQITEEQAQQGRRLFQQFNALTTSADRLALSVGGALAPALSEAMNRTDAWVRANERYIGTSIAGRVSDVASGTATFIRFADAAVTSTLGWERATTLLGAALSVRLLTALTGLNALRLAPWLAGLLGGGTVAAAGIGLAAGAAGGAANATVTDDLGRPIGNAGGAEGERNAQQRADGQAPIPGWRPGLGYILQRMFGWGGGGGAPAGGQPRLGGVWQPNSTGGAIPPGTPGNDQAPGISRTAAEFQSAYGPSATRIGARLGVDPRIILAQWDLETGRRAQPGTNNPGNMHAQPGQSGTWATDNQNGQRHNFANYGSLQEMEDATVERLGRRWAGVRGSGANVGQYVSGLRVGQQGGYAQSTGEDVATREARYRAGLEARMRPYMGFQPQVGIPTPPIPPPPPAAATPAPVASPLDGAQPQRQQQGSVDVNVRFANAPRGLVASVRPEGNVNADAPLVETAMQDYLAA